MEILRRSSCLAFSLVVGLGGCGGYKVTGAPPDLGDGLTTVGPADPCGAGRLQGLVGQSGSAANAAALPAESRILYPEMGNGVAFRQKRVTVKVDASNTITSVGCG